MGYEDRDRGRGRQDDGKYVRLTGLWENRNKRGMFTGKIRNQDIQKIMRKLEECDDKRADVVVFLWENNNKRGQKDPDFTVQIAEAEDRGGGRGGYSNRDRGRDDRDRNERDDRDGRSDRGGRSREDERDSGDGEDERDGRDEDDRDSGRDDDGGEEDSERRSRPASKGKPKSDKGGSKSSRSGAVKDKAPDKGKGKKEDDW